MRGLDQPGELIPSRLRRSSADVVRGPAFRSGLAASSAGQSPTLFRSPPGLLLRAVWKHVAFNLWDLSPTTVFALVSKFYEHPSVCPFFLWGVSEGGPAFMQLLRGWLLWHRTLFVSPVAAEPGRLPGSRSQAREPGLAAGGGPEMD